MGMRQKILDGVISFGTKAKNFLGDAAENATEAIHKAEKASAQKAIDARSMTKAQWKEWSGKERARAYKEMRKDASQQNAKFDLNKSVEQVSGVGGREVGGLDFESRLRNLRENKIAQGDTTKKAYQNFVKKTKKTYSIPEAEIKAVVAGKPYNESIYDDLRNADDVKKSGMANLMWNHKGATAAVGIGAAWGVSELTEE